jgi:hypothetical protein
MKLGAVAIRVVTTRTRAGVAILVTTVDVAAAVPADIRSKERGDEEAGAAAEAVTVAPLEGAGLGVATVRRIAVVGGRSITAANTTGVRMSPRETNEVAAASERGNGRDGTTAIVVGVTTPLTRKTRDTSKNTIVVAGMKTSIIVDDLGRGKQSLRLSRPLVHRARVSSA